MRFQYRAMEVSTGVHQFPTGAFNWYVIEEGGRLTLVDAGFPGHFQTFLKGLAEQGWTLKDVEAVVLTHAHADHTGFAERGRQQTGVPVYVHGKDAAMAKSRLQLPWAGLIGNAWRPYTAGMLGQATWDGVFTMPAIQKVVECRDGQGLDIPGRPRLIHTAGHTAGEVVLYLEQRRVVLSGDALVTRDLFSGAHTLPQVPREALNQDDRAARSSIGKLRELGEVTLLPGHGRPWKGTLATILA